MGAPVVLFVDALSFLVAFAIVITFLPSTVGELTTSASRTLLAGVRALLRDQLLGPWTISVGGFEAAWQMLVASLSVLAFVRYDGDPKVVGIALGGLGLGAVTGNLLAIRLLGRIDPARLAILAKALQVFAFWALVVDLPRFGLAGVLLVAGLMSGMVTAPVTGIRTMPMPADLPAANGSGVPDDDDPDGSNRASVHRASPRFVGGRASVAGGGCHPDGVHGTLRRRRSAA